MQEEEEKELLRKLDHLEVVYKTHTESIVFLLFVIAWLLGKLLNYNTNFFVLLMLVFAVMMHELIYKVGAFCLFALYALNSASTVLLHKIDSIRGIKRNYLKK